MIFYGLLGAVTIALACLVDNRASCCAKAVGGMGMTRRQACSCAALFTLFLVLAGTAALRIDVGNDYGNYVNTFHEIYVGGYVVTEPGFNCWYVSCSCFPAGRITCLFLACLRWLRRSFS